MSGDDQEPKLFPELDQAWPAPEPSEGFADRVVQAWEQEAANAAPTAASAKGSDPTTASPAGSDPGSEPAAATAPGAGPAVDRRRRARTRVALALALAAVAASAAVAWTLRGSESLGVHTGSTRAQLAIGSRAVAVAEAGAALSWKVARSGTADVTQQAGDVFYRVERGGPFVVHTAAGEVRVVGTCFRVEVSEMKKGLLQMGAGAAIATAVLVTVYEGKVLLANEHGQTAVAAGERAHVQAGRAPSSSESAREPGAAQAAAVSAPGADATREELLARDRTQRSELERLRKRVGELEVATSGAAGKRPGEVDNGHFLSPTRDELQELAKECRLKWDTPGIGVHPQTASDKLVRELGLSEQERAEYDRVSAELNQKAWSEMRSSYLEITGDKAGADNLTPDALRDEVYAKSNQRDIKEVYQRMARERAGLAEPPKSTQGLPPIERMQRMLSSLGDTFEQELGRAIGPDRARALRSQNDGWGSKHISSYGCPE